MRKFTHRDIIKGVLKKRKEEKHESPNCNPSDFVRDPGISTDVMSAWSVLFVIPVWKI